MLDPEGMIYHQFSKHHFFGAARDVANESRGASTAMD